MTVAVCTIAAVNYTPQIRVMARSYLTTHPSADVVWLLMLDQDDMIDDKQNFLRVPVKWLDNGTPYEEMAKRYSVVEYATALKPFFLDYIFKHSDVDTVLYFDPDVVFMRRIDCILNDMNECNILLTPHLLDPPDQMKEVSKFEAEMINNGVFNLGFIGIRRSDETFRFLDWWKKHLIHDCRFAQPLYFVDQKWVSMAPCYYRGVKVHHCPNCNIAWWNLAQRDKNISTATFVHFSGYDLQKPNQVSKYAEGLMDNDIEKYPGFKSLASQYAGWIKGSGYDEYSILSPRHREYLGGS